MAQEIKRQRKKRTVPYFRYKVTFENGESKLFPTLKAIGEHFDISAVSIWKQIDEKKRNKNNSKFSRLKIKIERIQNYKDYPIANL